MREKAIRNFVKMITFSSTSATMICHFISIFLEICAKLYKNSKIAKTAYIKAWCKLTYSFEEVISSRELIDKISRDRSN